jgi:hypothetical protein
MTSMPMIWFGLQAARSGIVDPVFYTQKPAGITNNDLSLIVLDEYIEELYPLTDIAGQSQVINTLRFKLLPIRQRTL